MSTYMYFRCLAHDPPLWSEGEISQHDDGNVGAAVALAVTNELLLLEKLQNGYATGFFLENAARFLILHPTCPIDVIAETGEVRHTVPGREKKVTVVGDDRVVTKHEQITEEDG